MTATVSPDEVFAIESLLTEEEKQIRDTVRSLVQRDISPHIDGCYARGDLPVRELAVELGKLNNVREALQIARTARTILGANGITAEYPVMRHANNLESVLTYEGTSEMHLLMIGQALTGHAAFQ